MLRFTGLAGVAAVGATVAELGDSSGPSRDLVILGTAMILGELFELRPAGRAALPLSFAVALVLVRAATPLQFVAVVGVAQVAASLLRREPAGFEPRVRLAVERAAQGLAAGGAYRTVLDGFQGEGRAAVLGALAAAAVAQIVVADLIVLVRDRRLAPLQARSADVAVVTSGVLMAVSYRGIGGQGDFGLWGAFLFSVPLLAAWYSFSLLASTRRSYQQTVRALGAAPELGGLVRDGHSERVSDLALSIGRDLGLDQGKLEHLEAAALLHHLGAVCLDEPPDGRSLEPAAVAAAGAEMLSVTEALAPAGAIVAAEPLLHRPPSPDQPPATLLGQVLKVASAFDELTEGDDTHGAWAVEALYTGPGYVYDGRVLDALERVLSRRGVLTATS